MNYIWFVSAFLNIIIDRSMVIISFQFISIILGYGSSLRYYSLYVCVSGGMGGGYSINKMNTVVNVS